MAIPLPTAPYPEPNANGSLPIPKPEETKKREPRFSTLDITFGIPIAIVFDLVALLEFPDPFLGGIEFLYYKKKGFKNSISGINSLITMVIKLFPILNWFPWYLISFLLMVYLDRSPEAEKYLEIVGKVTSTKTGGGAAKALPGPPPPALPEIRPSEVIDATKKTLSPQAREVTEQDFGMPEENPLTSVRKEEFEAPVIRDELRERRERKAAEENVRQEELSNEEEERKNEELDERMNTGNAEIRRIKGSLEKLPFDENSLEEKAEEEEGEAGETIVLKKYRFNRDDKGREGRKAA